MKTPLPRCVARCHDGSQCSKRVSTPGDTVCHLHLGKNGGVAIKQSKSPEDILLVLMDSSDESIRLRATVTWLEREEKRKQGCPACVARRERDQAADELVRVLDTHELEFNQLYAVTHLLELLKRRFRERFNLEVADAWQSTEWFQEQVERIPVADLHALVDALLVREPKSVPVNTHALNPDLTPEQEEHPDVEDEEDTTDEESEADTDASDLDEYVSSSPDGYYAYRPDHPADRTVEERDGTGLDAGGDEGTPVSDGEPDGGER